MYVSVTQKNSKSQENFYLTNTLKILELTDNFVESEF